jgi:formylmethanofuran:tetrahydromethanopterin formyltransferase
MKRVIGISTFGYDIAGNHTFYLAANTEEAMNAGSRRVTRTKTLDGSAVAYDAGYSVADITWSISVEARNVLVGNWIAWIVRLII